MNIGGMTMINSFEELCDDLHIDSMAISQQQMEQLGLWCREHISTDIPSQVDFDGDYQRLAEQFFDFKQSALGSIIYAAYHGYDRYIAELPDCADDALNGRNQGGMSPLHLAAVRGNVNTVHALVVMGAVVTQMNNALQMPLYSALLRTSLETDLSRREAIFKELLALAPESIDHRDENNETVIHLMARFGFNALLAEALNQNSDRAFYQNKDSHFPIHSAILGGQSEAVERLLKIDKVAELTDANKQTALHYAARYAASSDAIIKCCIDTAPDLNVRDKGMKTPFILAAESNNYPAMEALIAAGADTTLSDYRRFTALHYAVRAQNDDLVTWLTSHTPLEPDHLEGLDEVRAEIQQGRYTF